MYEPLRNLLLGWLKVPPEPHPPQGDPASLRVFRAGRNYYRLRLFGWGITQIFALAGILFWTGILIQVERTARAEQSTPAAPLAPATKPATNETIIVPARPMSREQRLNAWRDRFVKNIQATQQQPGRFARWWAASKRVCVEVALVLPPWVFPIVWALKISGFVVYLAQLAISYTVRRLDYEMRWYLVTDRSLRLRHGVWVVRESTMSFANIQQVTVTQGPLQRLLGLGDVKVDSAGGRGGGANRHEQPGEDMHTGHFHSVTNAEEIRDLILERLRRFRESGLGDPEEKHPPTTAVLAPASTPLLAAARELAAEARALRTTLAAR